MDIIKTNFENPDLLKPTRLCRQEEALHLFVVDIASGDLSEAFYDAAQAFNYAERYQTVVIHLLDKALASTIPLCKHLLLGWHYRLSPP